MFHFPSPNIARHVCNDGPELAAFRLQSPFDGAEMLLLIGHLDGWEYAQVVGPDRCPTWDEMKLVKDACWDAEDVCLQLHPAASRYINKSEFSLWIWRPTEQTIPQPPLHSERIAGCQAK